MEKYHTQDFLFGKCECNSCATLGRVWETVFLLRETLYLCQFSIL